MRTSKPLVPLILVALALVASLWWWDQGERHVGGLSPAVGAPGPVRGADREFASAIPPEIVPEAARAALRAGPAAGTPAGSARWVLRVLDARGAPIVAARVLVARTERGLGVPLENLDAETFTWARREDHATDAQGEVRLESLLAAPLKIRVRARGFAPRDVTVARAERGARADVVLDDSVVLVGRVVDAARRPVPGATLRRLERDAPPAVIFSAAEGDVAATTDAEGRFRVDEIGHGAWRLLVRATGHPDRLEAGATDAPGVVVTGLEFVLGEGAIVRGRVVGAPADEVLGLWVHAARSSAGRVVAEDPQSSGILVENRRAACGADGEFELTGLTPGSGYRLVARDGENPILGVARSAPVEVSAGDLTVEIPYRARGALVFSVVDDADSKPLDEFEVRFGGRFRVPLTDASGRVRREFEGGRVRFEHGLARAADETFELTIQAPGHAPLTVPGLRPEEGLDLDLGTLRLTRTQAIEVRVVDGASEKPLAGARVGWARANPPAGAAARDAELASTDAAGRARLDVALEAGARLGVAHADFAPAWVGPFPGGTTPAEVVVRLSAGGRAVVSVRDRLGASVRGAIVRHSPPHAPLERDVARHGLEYVTDDAGRVTFARLEPGEHAFEVADTPGARSAARIAEGDEVEVLLTVPARGRLTGRVTESGQPLSGVTLRFARRAEPERDPSGAARALATIDARTNGFGEYAIASLPLGEYAVSVLHPGRIMAFETEARLGDAQGRFDVNLPLAAIGGRIVDEEGRPVTGVVVRVLRAAGGAGEPRAAGPEDSRVWSDADGRYVARGVACGVDLVIEALSGTFQPARSGVVRVEPGQFSTDVDLRLVLGAELEVSVAGGDGRPLVGCAVRLDRADAGSPTLASPAGTTDAQGLARFRGLEVGRWRVRVEPRAEAGGTPGARAEERTVELARGAPQRVRVEFP